MSTEVGAGRLGGRHGGQLRFGFETPPGWLVIRTDPGYWQLDCERLLVDANQQTRLAAADKRDLRDLIDAAVQQCQSVGTVAIALLIAKGPDPRHPEQSRLVLSSLTLTFSDAGEHQAELLPSRLALEADQDQDSTGEIAEFDTELGPGLVRTSVSGAGADLPAELAQDGLLAQALAHLPIPPSPLTAVVQCTINDPDQRDLAASLATRMLKTLTVLPESGGPDPARKSHVVPIR